MRISSPEPAVLLETTAPGGTLLTTLSSSQFNLLLFKMQKCCSQRAFHSYLDCNQTAIVHFTFAVISTDDIVITHVSRDLSVQVACLFSRYEYCF
jgi:hypothetical protein